LALTPFILRNNLKRFTSSAAPILLIIPARKDSAVLPTTAPGDKSPACG